MKFVIIFAALFAVALASPAAPQGDAVITHSESDVQTHGYKWAWGTSDGTEAQEAGQLKNIGSEDEAISVSGSYKYVGDDGVTYEVKYIADENGFQPQGAHLPVA